MGNINASAVVVRVPLLSLAGFPLRWRVCVGDSWGDPGDQITVPPGPLVVAIVAKTVTPAIWVEATIRFPIDVDPKGITVVTVPLGNVLGAFASRWAGAGRTGAVLELLDMTTRDGKTIRFS